MMLPSDVAVDVLHRLPLAEAVRHLWHWPCDAPFLKDLFATHRGAGSTQELTFATVVAFIGAALLAHDGSGRPSFQRGRAQGELTVSDQQLGRLPLAVREAWLATSTQRLRAVLPQGAAAAADLPDSVAAVTVIALDGQVINRVPQRRRPLRSSSGGVLGGKALVAWHLASGLAVARATDPDGETNEVQLLPDVLPPVQTHDPDVLWLADAQCGNPAQAAAFTARTDDHFLVRDDGKTTFVRDLDRPVPQGQDAQGRTDEEDWGWWGGPRHAHRRYVRRITWTRPNAAPIILLTDLLDAAPYPAVDLLALDLARWDMARVFQPITEVFPLRRWIGSTPRGTLFPLAFCLLWYNQIQVVRADVAAGAQRPAAEVSAALWFEDVQRQWIALHEVLPPEEVVGLVPEYAPAAQLRRRLQALRHPAWKERWHKAPAKKRTPPHTGAKNREHKSADRLIQEYRLARNQRVQT